MTSDRLKWAMGVVEKLEQIKEIKKQKEEHQRMCKHEWKSRYDFVYDYDHQDCAKCGASRMV